MNCKPGDLAVVIAARYTKEMVGRYVIVIRLAEPHEYRGDPDETGPVWIVKSASGGTLPVEFYAGGTGRRVERPFLDKRLRPIRDPGEDAQDETLQWLPVPTRDKVPA